MRTELPVVIGGMAARAMDKAARHPRRCHPRNHRSAQTPLTRKECRSDLHRDQDRISLMGAAN
jgi:hypothetical protein